jgi:hypothetical protein
MHQPNEQYIYTQEEYLQLLRNSKFGLSLRGYGPKCNREIELMAFGTVPIIDEYVSMSYYDPPQENIHYFRINQPSDIKNVINNCSKEQWIKMSTACREWYNKNCSLHGSFNTTMKIINDFSKKNENGNRFDFNYVFNIKNTFIKNK